MNMHLIRRIISVKGIVQGVGFRPFVYNTANRFNLRGHVLNKPEGVEIDLEGAPDAIDSFLDMLKNNAPPLAKIDEIVCKNQPLAGYNTFEIALTERVGSAEALVSVDVALCEDCLKELRDPLDRRYHYPFINCTNCGPRFTIIKDMPYDREFTTMHPFPMCEACDREYHDPGNRRFHAQPNACPVCGPHVALINREGEPLETKDPVKRAAHLMKGNSILAIKGLGGYHLACNALDDTAVKLLRQRKIREDKPFALMVKDLEQAKEYCYISQQEAEQMSSPYRPILLVKKKENTGIASQVAPGNEYLGMMLPYTPLHYLIFEHIDFPLVMTSANLSDEPIAYRDQDALTRLNKIADYFLIHNREIHHRCDDSVIRIYKNEPYFIRRSRGFAPAPVRMFETAQPILAVGAEQKNTFCLTKGSNVFISHHIGDLENMETLRSFEEEIEMYKTLFHVEPELVVYDNHPEYLSTKYAIELPIAKTGVQHHHAHIASCMAEHRLEGHVLGIAFDGTGLGQDGTIWGGEFLYASYLDYKRLAHLKYVPMPGGAKAVKEPWRMAAGHLYSAFGPDWTRYAGLFVKNMDSDVLETMNQMMARNINAPLTSSMGRLFDAVSALLGIRDKVNYEGQAAVEMEQMAAKAKGESFGASNIFRYGLTAGDNLWEIDTGPMLEDILHLVRQNRFTPDVMAMAFHHTIKDMIVDICLKGRTLYGEKRVCLSGGVFQNLLLLEMVDRGLTEQGFEVYVHRLVPTNDGGLCLGQAAIAAERVKAGVI